MDIKKLQAFDQLTPKDQVGKPIDLGKGPSFKDALDKLKSGTESLNQVVPQEFAEVTKSQTQNPVKFSNHAIERMSTRGINFSQVDLERINQAVDKAAAKGAKDSLILMNDSALIVSVKNKTIVTVMDKAQLKENVFTNIDSTVVM